MAGFIGSHLLETLLSLGQRVIGLDNLSTGSPLNLEDVRARAGEENWSRFTFHQGDIRDIGPCREATRNVDFVLHQAGFVSVPLSIEDPIGCFVTNVSGTLNLLIAARDHGVKRVVYASSSAVYGDDSRLPKIETQIGKPLSPYGASKAMNEVQAQFCLDHYGLQSVGLRYFNVFGPRQNPAGGYAAVIPQWITAQVRNEVCTVHGDGSITRDFCHIANVVQANLLAAAAPGGSGRVFNVALGARTTLLELHEMIAAKVAALGQVEPRPLAFGPPRPGDILHSGADIGRITAELGFKPEVSVEAGLEETVWWYAAAAQKAAAPPCPPASKPL